MTFRTSLALSAVALLASPGLVLAADLPSRKAPPPVVLAAPPPPIFTWTGLYVGANVGYGRSAGASDIDGLRVENGILTPLAEPFQLNGPKPAGVLGGVQAGYNQQFGRFVLGVETDFQGSALSGASRGAGPIIPGHNFAVDAEATQRVKWFGTARARIGYTLFDPRFLVYATGGLAYGDVHYSQSFLDSDGDLGLTRQRATRLGWTAGAGAEWAFARHWSLKLEYLYTDLGRGPDLIVAEITPGLGMQPDVHKTFNTNRTQFHTVRAGLNYRFDLFGPSTLDRRP